ncbi:hypothetical protein CC85DRAFT_329854 [Cutaneotrichosporon oleaginosum]|uniref:Prokaryotic-type class I peptide chain release factors domain-containing protein n=1 Tax=Cutaneotrichosporon oleaginosum TaxID=879819 RepID=A0A0J0XH72_9TREE|nr:uncharacterized protein CC85DRAFT_329854 [Cutaneotrichosporon oleaginosum]KLT40445.1 hypothetical protein CC85DRAFT_329854 [Cutaneotrichosporon oleaginosum]TXT15362.1 hypothetical protein COLE_01555 [Cutaneotrichosporon oleaginosum]
MSFVLPRLARVAATSLRRPLAHATLHPAPLAGCSHWRGMSRKAERVSRAEDDAAVEIGQDALEADFFAAEEVEAEWGEEVEDGVFVDVPDFTHARHAKAAEAAESAEPKPPPPPRRVPTSIKQMNRLLGRHQVPDLPEHELDEKFVRGRGPGGQAINKTNSSVCLVHIPTGIRVQAQPTRSREQNRYVARQILKDRLDLMRARGELPNADGSYSTPKAEAEGLSRKERLAAEARTWSKQELRWEKERRRKLNRKKKVNKRKKKGAEDEEDEVAE